MLEGNSCIKYFVGILIMNIIPNSYGDLDFFCFALCLIIVSISIFPDVHIKEGCNGSYTSCIKP